IGLYTYSEVSSCTWGSVMRSRFRLALVAGSCGLLAACGTAPDVTGTGGAPPAAAGSTQQPGGGPTSRRAGGPSHTPGGGAPITIPNIIIQEGGRYRVRDEEEKVNKVVKKCGFCVTVKVDLSNGQCLVGVTSDPEEGLRQDPDPSKDGYLV